MSLFLRIHYSQTLQNETCRHAEQHAGSVTKEENNFASKLSYSTITSILKNSTSHSDTAVRAGYMVSDALAVRRSKPFSDREATKESFPAASRAAFPHKKNTSFLKLVYQDSPP